jgi:hypothetical protein
VSWLTEPDEEWDTDPDAYRKEPKSRLKVVALVLAGWLVVSALVLIGLLAFGGRHGSTSAIRAPEQGRQSSSASPSPSRTASLPSGWVQRASDDQPDCAAHSYGEVQAFFIKTPCSSVHRRLATTNPHGRTVVVATSVVTFDTAAQAATYRSLVTSDGTGNVSDLLREGVGYPGAPAELPAAAFASRQSGNRVLVTEAGYATGTSDSDDSTLKAVATQGVDAP